MSMHPPRAVIVIPARYGSTRFPGKPLAQIRGRSMLERIWRIAKEVKNISEVYVATDDQRIAHAAQAFGAQAIMTPESCRNGTERAYEAVRDLNPRPELIINFQGDAVLTPPWFIQSLVDSMIADPAVQLATPAVRETWEHYQQILESKKSNPFSGTFVTFDRNHNALYFSKSVIPAVRERGQGLPPVFHHIGIYGYRFSALERYLTLAPGLFEVTEGLEQLRALEHGIPIRVVQVDWKGRTAWAVDSPEDVQRVEAIIDREGELVSS